MEPVGLNRSTRKCVRRKTLLATQSKEDINMTNPKTPTTLAISILLLIGLVGCNSVSSTPVPTSTPQVAIQGSNTREKLQVIELSGCGSKADIKRIEKRTRSVDVTISAEVAAKLGIPVQVINAEVQASVGAALKIGAEEETSIELVAPPDTRMVFQVVWIGKEEVGVVQYFRGLDMPIVFSSFTPTDFRIKGSQDIHCDGNALIPVNSTEVPISAPLIVENFNCGFINELLSKSQVTQILMGGRGVAGVQTRLLEPVDVPTGWTVHKQGVTYNGPVRFEVGTFASFWAPNLCEPLEIPSANNAPLTIVSQSTILPITNVSDSFRDTASRKCNEFGGKPKKIDVVTNQLLEEWRRIGDTGDRNSVGRIIYCEIHQIPNFEGFVSGDSIPSGAIITADIGSNWSKRYAGSLEGIAYYGGGGWGVFRTIKSLTMQNAGGQYWLIK
jgi:hypothetical protein